MRQAAVALAIAMTGSSFALSPVRAETIVKERFGCHAQEVTERLFMFVQTGEENAFDQLLRGSLASGECRSWKTGEAVAVQARSGPYSCLAPKETAERCYWTPVSAIEAGQ